MPRLVRLVLLVAGIAIAAPAAAQSFPSKPVRLVVPNPAGGTVDLLARVLAGRLAETWGQQPLIENRPGASAVIAADYTLKQPADGHALLIVANAFLINAALRADLSYDPIRDFVPVSQLVFSPLALVVNTASPVRSLGELLERARARPAQVSIASVGPATTHHLAIEALKRAGRISLVYAPYTGGAPAVNALLGGHVESAVANYSEVARYVDGGKLRALAVLTSQRVDALKDVPTVAESGMPGFEATPWYGIVVRAGVPSDVLRKLAGDIAAAVRHPEVREKLIAQGFYPLGHGPDEFGAHMRAQLEKLRATVRESGITPN